MTLHTTTSASLDLLIPHTEPTLYARLLEIFQNRKIIFLCLIFSILMHVVFLIRFSGLENEHNLEKPVSHSVDIILSKYIPDQPPQILQEIIPVKPKPIEKPKPTPVEKTITKPAESQPVVEEKIIEEIPEEITEEAIEEEQIETEQFVQNQPNNAPSDPAFLVNEKKQYLETIAAHLDKHKFYPRSARRRHIEGGVKVSFDLLPDGNILNLKVFSGHSVLQKATSNSISSSLPMPHRPENLLALNTMKIEYTMQYALN